MRNWILLILARFMLLVVVGCNDARGRFDIYSGDLLFVDFDGSPLCVAIEKVTDGYHGYNFSHVGIVEINYDGVFVIDAVSSGVRCIELGEFLEQCSVDGGGHAKVVVGRLNDDFVKLIEPALKRGRELIGKDYDKPFVIGNDQYYCSELVYEVFKYAANGTEIFELNSMTFKDPDTGQFFPVWVEYYQKLGVAIPEGEPGINPGGISRSGKLRIFEPWGKCSRKQ
jgi:permuted papain-like amidase YaeF/Yiix C92 family enzyme